MLGMTVWANLYFKTIFKEKIWMQLFLSKNLSITIYLFKFMSMILHLVLLMNLCVNNYQISCNRCLNGNWTSNTSIKKHNFINQAKYYKERLKRFGMENPKGISTPSRTSCYLYKDEGDKSVEEIKYRGMIISLLYLNISRPNIMFFCLYVCIF